MANPIEHAYTLMTDYLLDLLPPFGAPAHATFIQHLHPPPATAFHDQPPATAVHHQPSAAHPTTVRVTPHGVHELLDKILSFVPDRDIPACTRVSRTWYLAAKPHLFREIAVDKFFHVKGARHPLVNLDRWDGLPLFRRAWLTRVCHTLDVETHHETFCACAVTLPASVSDWAAQPFTEHARCATPEPVTGADAYPSPMSVCSDLPSLAEANGFPYPSPPQLGEPLLPPLPHLRTLRTPFDVHGTLTRGEPAVPCGLTALRPRHLVQRDWYFLTEGDEATTSRFARGSIRSYTAFLSPRELDFEARNNVEGPLTSLPSEALGQGCTVTLVCPPAPTGPGFEALSPHCKHHACFHTHTPPAVGAPVDPAIHQAYLSRCPGGACPHSVFAKLAFTAIVHSGNGQPRTRLVGFEVLDHNQHHNFDFAPWVHAHLSWLSRWMVARLEGMGKLQSRAAMEMAERIKTPYGPDLFQMVKAETWRRRRAGRRSLQRHAAE